MLSMITAAAVPPRMYGVRLPILVFVLSGEGVMEDIEKYGVQPTYCMQNIREVLNTLEKGEPK